MPSPIDPVKVNTADGSLTGGCLFCGNQFGPFSSPHLEILGHGFAYLCARCVRLHARVLGLDAGDEQAALLNVREREAELEKQVDRLTKQRNARQEELVRQKKLNEEIVATNEWQAQRILQLEAAIREDARAKLATVGADDE